MFLLTAPIFKNSHILAGIDFTFIEARPRLIPKALNHQIGLQYWKKQLSSTANFRTFFAT